MTFKNLELGDVDTAEEECEHEPDWQSVRPVPELPGVVDVWCSKCGLSGSITLNKEDILW